MTYVYDDVTHVYDDVTWQQGQAIVSTLKAGESFGESWLLGIDIIPHHLAKISPGPQRERCVQYYAIYIYYIVYILCVRYYTIYILYCVQYYTMYIVYCILYIYLYTKIWIPVYIYIGSSRSS